MIKRKRFVVISYILLIVIIVLSTLIWQARQIENQVQDIESVPKIEKEEVIVESEDVARLVPSRPEDYGMIVTSTFDKPKTQAEWNELLDEKLSEVKSQISPETVSKVKQMIQEDAAKTQDKLAKIDKSIQECKEILRIQPDNKEIQEKLERLMILKGLASAFENF